jgi:Holliday junction resolvase RusA-like endonuclease
MTVHQSIPGATSGPVCTEGGVLAPSSITQLVVPAPPSVNAMFRNVPGKGRVRTKLYDDWRGHAGWRLKLQNPEPVRGDVVILVGVERANGAADVDNRIKALFDLLVEHGVIEDDSKVVGFAAAWSPQRDSLARIAVMPAAPLFIQFQLASEGSAGGWFMQEPPQSEDRS